MNYTLSQIRMQDKRAVAELDALLQREDIRRDPNLDYIVGLYDDDYRLVASGALFANTLRCLAVDDGHQGEGLMAQVVTHLGDRAMAQGHSHLFLYTKCDKAHIFGDMGFYEIARVEGQVAFMENRRDGFSSFLRRLEATRKPGTTAALVMNCNPFTLGHRHLVERAAGENDHVHLFVVSEDASLFPFADRYELVRAGCADLGNVTLHPTESYMISSAVFPSYFLRDSEAAIEVQAQLDLTLFGAIAGAVGATRRYVGEEPFSEVTGIYNRIMQRALPDMGIGCVVIPRAAVGDQVVSASKVRQLIHDGQLEAVKKLVPPTTYDYFFTERGQAVVKRIEAAQDVVHY